MSRIRASDARFVRPAEIAEGAVVSVFRVPPEGAGQRLDVFVQGQLHRTSRTRAQVIVRASAYDAGGRRLKPSDRVRAEQCILLWRPAWDETPVPTDIPIVWEDEHLLAVAKPALVPVHPTARYHKNTLIKMLEAARPDCDFLSLGHRLDRETSGVILVSKTRACDRALKRQLEARDGIEKEYVALTRGVPSPPGPPSAARRPAAPFRYERPVELDPTHALRVKMRITDAPGALYAATRFDVERVRVNKQAQRYARVRCHLETGRQHQIRVHLASLGAPIVGDKLYGEDDGAFARAADGCLTDDDVSRLELPRHALHARRLALPHPITGAPLVLEAPVPADMEAFWATLEDETDDGAR